MTEATRSGSTRAAMPESIRFARRNRKVTGAVAVCALAAVAAVGIAQPLLATPAATQAAASYQPSLADITRANTQSYSLAVTSAQQDENKAAASFTATRGNDVEVELEPEQTVTAEADSSGSADSGDGASSLPSAVSYDPSTVQGQAQQYLESIGRGDQWGCFDAIISQESGWNPSALNASSGAYGLPQALPGSKMASAGSDWASNPITQVKWAVSYMEGRYGSICGAYDFKFTQGNGWY